jgi:hypothetical protein
MAALVAAISVAIKVSGITTGRRISAVRSCGLEHIAQANCNA